MKNLLLGSIVVGSLAVSLRADDAIVLNASDSQLNHQIHSAIVEDSTLPYCAHVVRVDCEKGKVMLDGRVHTQEEKTKIGLKADDIAGHENVVNRVVVAVPAPTSR